MQARFKLLFLMISNLLAAKAGASDGIQIFNSIAIREDAAKFIHESPITTEDDDIDGKTYRGKKLFVKVPNPLPANNLFADGYALISVICFPEPVNRCDLSGESRVPEMGVMDLSQNYSFYGEQAKNIYKNFSWKKVEAGTNREIFGCAPNDHCPFNLTYDDGTPPILTFNVEGASPAIKAFEAQSHLKKKHRTFKAIND